MQNFNRETLAPCIVNEGILINRKDMLRALETLESVKYAYIVDGNVISQGEGVVVKIFSSPETSTLVVNGCLFLNILSFNYLHFYMQDNGLTTIELVEDSKTLQLIPIEEDARRINKVNREIFSTGRYDEEAPAELFDEMDDDDRF
ncbi:MAG: hypothetical protein COW32_08605 [Candidatus Aquicultor secundus]|uniref:Uncharacterized protein n=1 Tax=Candidatus Aquicultor secundus TaxID=1973895 RepID=A0A2M7T552_9ACTN|nr:hypothetical protein [Candidatus Aquicultor secundus]NCO65724.1 hypothetical protein [Solirubrobacter sp.]OIO88689.1 MAG: hypothetical protein AUK32_00865 [Candidatus Aquicultor secundus]PIU26629.1 MAG: hypothetical protein COT10_07655 [Candidatus Aquicultor secundus]PIW21719.1 MAG: hypothetical protein COW32_08605 [Candidatus Aquicultor secundus]PIX53187.1 MAG: hypothetical protein COZ51_00180 [Candidatus Aquicultor secundus]